MYLCPNAETHKSPALPDASPPGFPDWLAAEQPRTGAAPVRPGSRQTWPSSVDWLRDQRGQPHTFHCLNRFFESNSEFCRCLITTERFSSFQACYLRGINSYGLQVNQCQEWLSQWLQVTSSLKGNICGSVCHVSTWKHSRFSYEASVNSSLS